MHLLSTNSELENVIGVNLYIHKLSNIDCLGVSTKEK